MSAKPNFLRLTALYFLLLLGYLYLHVIDVDKILYPSTGKEEVKSKIDFAYQNF